MDIGTHCSFPSCNRLDFLPFSCDSCQGIFCKEHQTPDTHNCNGLHSEHKLLISSDTSSSSSSSRPLSYPCSLRDCKRRDKVEIQCPYCRQIFCIHHRHQQDHGCPALVQVDKQRTSDSRERSIAAAAGEASRGPGGRRSAAGSSSSATAANPKVIKGARSESTQAKVAIMKLKLKAEGMESIPQSERVYYDLQLPRDSGLPNKAMFFSKEWSIGKIVDIISRKYHLHNENDKQHSQKLLLHSLDGEAFNLSKPLGDFLDNCPSGSLVILDYANVPLS